MAAVNITNDVHNGTEFGLEVRFFALPSVLTIAIGVVIVAGNTITLLAIKASASFRTAPDFYLASLAVADGLVGITAISKIYTYFGSGDESGISHVPKKYACLAVLSLASTSVMSSTFSLALVALDRCLSVSYPFLYKSMASKKRTLQIILGAWLCSIVYGLLLVVFNKYSKHHKCLLVVQVDIWYVRYLTTCLSFIGVSVSIMSYYKIGQILMRNQSKREFSSFADHFLCCSRSESLAVKDHTGKTSQRFLATRNRNPMPRGEFSVRKELSTLKSAGDEGQLLVHLNSKGDKYVKRENWRTMLVSKRSPKTQENRAYEYAGKPPRSLTLEKHSFTQTLHHHDDIVDNHKPEQVKPHVKKMEEIDSHLGEVNLMRQDVMDKSFSDTGICTSSTNNDIPDYFPVDLIRTSVYVKKSEGKALMSDNRFIVARSKTLPNLKCIAINFTPGACCTSRQFTQMCPIDWRLNSKSPCSTREDHFNRGKESLRKVPPLSLSLPCRHASPQRCESQDPVPNTMAGPQESPESHDQPRLNLDSCRCANQNRSCSFKYGHNSDPELESTTRTNDYSSCCSEDAVCDHHLSGLSHRKSLSDQKLGRPVLAKDSARVIRMIFFTQVLFVACITPGFFLCLLYGLANVPVWLINWAPFIAFLNSAMNIFVYVSCKSRYQVAIWSILKCGQCRQ